MKNDIFGKEIGLGTTPTFFFLKQNSTKVAALQGFHPYSVFKNVIDQMLVNRLYLILIILFFLKNLF